MNSKLEQIRVEIIFIKSGRSFQQWLRCICERHNSRRIVFDDDFLVATHLNLRVHSEN